MKKIKKYSLIIKNFSYNLSYQILALFLPIITTPYITRVFTRDTIGLLSVTEANCSYFVLLGMLGITLLGPREIAKCLGNKEILTDTFFDIYRIQFIAHIIAGIIYICYCGVTGKSSIAYMYLLYLTASMFDISWFYIGIEEFKAISFRNVFVKLVSFAMLFLCVRKENDIYVYIETMYIPQMIINIYMWGLLIKKYIFFEAKRIVIAKNNYIKEALSLFVPQVASSIYTVLDKTILGMYTTYSTVAIYTQGQTLLRLILAIVPCFSRVMSPRISYYIAKKADDEIQKYMEMSANVIGYLSFLLFFGVLSYSQLFIDWYLPSAYKQTGEVLKICSPIILAVSGANLFSIQYLIPLGKQNKYTFSIIVSTIVNMSINFALAPIWGIYGVCLGSVIAEITGFLIQMQYARKTLNLISMFRNYPSYILSGGIMYIISQKMDKYYDSNIIKLAMLICISGCIYIIVTYIIKKGYTFTMRIIKTNRK